MKTALRSLALFATLAALCAIVWGVSRGSTSEYERFDGQAFGTHYRITYQGDAGPNKVRQAVEAELDRIDQLASTWIESSELMRYNRSKQPESFELSSELAELIRRAEAIEAQTDGAFSPRPNGESIDLSGIAKGYAVDRIAQLLGQTFRIENHLVDIGGEIKAHGKNTKGLAWQIGLVVPTKNSNTQTHTVQLRDTSIATSGLSFRGNHIINPANGEPAINRLHSVSVIHPSNTTADALATALYVMGPDTGPQWAEDNNIHAIFILNDGTKRETIPDALTPGLER